MSTDGESIPSYGVTFVTVTHGLKAEDLPALRERAEAGDDEAQNLLAAAYLFGHHVPEDDKQYEYWTRQAAGNGNFDAALELGNGYGRGHGKKGSLPLDPVEGLKWLYVARHLKSMNNYMDISADIIEKGLTEADKERARSEAEGVIAAFPEAAKERIAAYNRDAAMVRFLYRMRDAVKNAFSESYQDLNLHDSLNLAAPYTTQVLDEIDSMQKRVWQRLNGKPEES